MINTSSEQVAHGVALVDETGRSLQTIVAQVADINTNVKAIVEAAHEQSLGLKEINTAVNLMDQNTQQNAAMVEETSAASHSLAKESEALRMLLGRFSFGKHSSPKMTPARPESRPVHCRYAHHGESCAVFRFRSGCPGIGSWEEF